MPAGLRNPERIPNDAIMALGTYGQGPMTLRSTTLAANTLLPNVLLGTPVVQAIPEDTVIISNIVANGDIVLATKTGDNSIEGLHIDSSASIVYVGSASYNVTLVNGAATLTLPSATGTLATLAGTESLSNKTLASPVVTGQVTDNTYVKHGIFRKTGMADATATAVFRITTTNETGNADAGVYTVVFTLHVDTLGLAGADFTGNVFSGEYKFTRAINGTGAGGTLSETTLTAVWTSGPTTTGGGTNVITSVTVTLVEVDEYNVDVKVACDYDNTDINRVNALIDAKLLWTQFPTAPTMSQQ